MHTCRGCDTLTTGSRAWHGAYVRWYDAALAGHKIRAAVYAWVADRLVSFA